MSRRILTAGALAAAPLMALALVGCGDGSGTPAKGSNPAMPPPDVARASAVNGLDKDGKPIDAVAAAEMPESELPPLKDQPAAAEPPAP